jgi:tRNA dimethylallyltransferase
VPETPLKPLVAIVGPTGSGKSDLALAIAAEFSGEVVNCDSLQIYRGFDIGTAKLPPAERLGIPHHLIDILHPDEIFTAGEFARRARAALKEISGREKLPVICGGTGFYLRALLDGLFAGPRRDEALRARLEARRKRRPESLHRILRRLDPPAARAIHSNDAPKLIRAIEVCLLTRRPLTELYGTGREALSGYAVLQLGLAPPRQALYQRLDERCRRMFAGGLVEEVRGILARGYPATAKPFESVGYKQAMGMLNGELTGEEALLLAQRSTRRYAKRQVTWFRADPRIEWLAGFGDAHDVRRKAIERVREFLAAAALEFQPIC